jgi:acyl-CoA dehydrogenase
LSDRGLILDATERLFSEACAPAAVRSVEGSWSPSLWDQLEKLGFTRIGVPDADGDLAEFADAVAVVGVAAGHAAPVPLAETLIAAQVASAAGLFIPRAPLTAASASPVQVRRTSAGVRVAGHLAGVPWGDIADELILVSDRARAVVPIDLAECDVVRTVNLAGEPHAGIQIAMDVDSGQIRDLPSDWSEQRLALTGAVFRAAQIAGALDRICSLTIAYASEREQFGRPIATFQAVQHHVAVLTGLATAARVASETAANAPQSLLAVAAAKAYVSRACGPAAMIAHQLHGAIGFTAEHQLQLFTRRLWSWSEEFGNEAFWATALANELARSAPADAWDLLSVP